MKFSIQIADKGAVRSIGWILECQPHILTRLAVGQIVVDIEMRILVVGKVIVDIGFAIHEFSGGRPFCMSGGYGSVMHPVDHITALKGMIAAQASLQPAGCIEEMGKRRRQQGRIKALQGGRFRFESPNLRVSQRPVPTEQPIVAGPPDEEDRSIAERGRRHLALCRLPVLPLGRCGERDRLGRTLFGEALQVAAVDSLLVDGAE